MSLYIRDD